MRLLLIRHGQTQANVDGILDAAVPGPGLTRLGREQAAALPDALADESIGGIWTSTLTRTRETAAPLAARRGMTPTELAGLREIGAGTLQGRSDREAVDDYVAIVLAWMSGQLQARMPGGESGREFLDRYDDAIDRVVGSGVRTAAVVSHAAAIRCWSARHVAGVDLARPDYYRLDNTGVVILDDDSGDWRLRSWAGRPIGGEQLADPSAEDPTGDAP